jgi:hypothetical protein
MALQRTPNDPSNPRLQQVQSRVDTRMGRGYNAFNPSGGAYVSPCVQAAPAIELLRCLSLQSHRQYQRRLPGMRDAGRAKVGGCRVIRRRVFNIAAGVSFLVLVAVVSLAMRSAWQMDVLTRGIDGNRTMGLFSGDDQITLLLWQVTGYRNNGQGFASPFRHEQQPNDRLARLMFLQLRWEGFGGLPDDPRIVDWGSFQYGLSGFRQADENPTIHCAYFSVRYWVVGIPFAIMPLATSIRIYRNRRRRTSGSCVHCGYNLTGNASGACPECGTACSTS